MRSRSPFRGWEFAWIEDSSDPEFVLFMLCLLSYVLAVPASICLATALTTGPTGWDSPFWVCGLISLGLIPAAIATIFLIVVVITLLKDHPPIRRKKVFHA